MFPPCQNEDKIGDGICQKKNNNFRCDYDGGDCCQAKTLVRACVECACHKFSSTRKIFLTTTQPPFIIYIGK